MRKLIIVLLLMMFSTHLFAQNKKMKIDMLELELEETKKKLNDITDSPEYLFMRFLAELAPLSKYKTPEALKRKRDFIQMFIDTYPSNSYRWAAEDLLASTIADLNGLQIRPSSLESRVASEGGMVIGSQTEVNVGEQIPNDVLCIISLERLEAFHASTYMVLKVKNTSQEILDHLWFNVVVTTKNKGFLGLQQSVVFESVHPGEESMAEVIFESVEVTRIGHLQLIPFLTEVSGRETSLGNYKIALSNPFDITVSVLR